MIIGIGHQRECGKDLIAKMMLGEIVARYRGIKPIKVSFAQGIYDIAYKLYGWAGFKDKDFYDENKDIKEKVLEKLGKSPRTILIEIGMKMREVYPETWLNTAIYQLADVIIIPDLRFQNEFDKIKEMGGHCIKIVRNSAPSIFDINDPDNQLLHEERWDWVIHNDGTKRELNTKMCEYMDWAANKIVGRE